MKAKMDTAKMDVKEAVKTAKGYIAQVFADENVQWIGLEEILFEDFEHLWKVTIGFSRPWGLAAKMSTLSGDPGRREYKVVQIDDRTGEVVSIINRDVDASE